MAAEQPGRNQASPVPASLMRRSVLRAAYFGTLAPLSLVISRLILSCAYPMLRFAFWPIFYQPRSTHLTLVS